MDCLIDKYWDDTVVPHHLTFAGTGMGTKPGDDFTVPLRQERHQQLHQKGERSFWKRHGYEEEQLINLAQGLYNGSI